MLTSGESKKDEKVAGNLGQYGTLTFWVDYIAKESGLRFPELIKSHEKQLIDKNLILSPFDKNGGFFPRSEFYRLTALGHHVCAFIGDYAPKN
jgi:hypothetical protein